MAFHACPTHPMGSEAHHVTGLGYGPGGTRAAARAEGSRGRQGVRPGRLHTAAHSRAGGVEASSARSCLKALTPSKAGARSHSSGTRSQKLQRALEGRGWPPRAGHHGLATLHGPSRVKPSHARKSPFGHCRRNWAGEQSLQGRRRARERMHTCLRVRVPWRHRPPPGDATSHEAAASLLLKANPMAGN